MKRLLGNIVAVTLSVLLLAAAREARGAEREVAKIEWKVKDVAAKDGVWEIVAPAEGGSVNVLKLEKPGVSESYYALKGQIAYENVKERGYLEMWNYFDDGGFFFTRTLGDSGPMGVIKGSSDWRSFILPFRSKPGNVPNKLEVNVVLPGGGTVKLKEAKLVEYPAPATKPATKAAAEPPRANSSKGAAWWGTREGGWAGGVIGSVIGLCGGIIGTLAGRGKARGFVTGLCVTLIVVCGVLFMTGSAALLTGQPYAVWYPLLLSGGLGGGIILALVPGIRRRYDEMEMRRMEALDAAG